MEQTTLEVNGMACDGCEANVTETLEAFDGVASVTANHETDEVRVEHDEGTAVDSIRDAIEDAGYEVVA